jgi:hypothetical protein
MTMTNREKYDFDCFTLVNYPRMVEIALARGFEFDFYKDDYDWSKKIILWRHDVEFSPYIALEMAKIETKLGVKATYFFQTHAETYNLFERSISDIALEVKSLGHEVGLHFDSHYWGNGSGGVEWMECCIRKDAGYFEDCLGIRPRVFSFHCTDDFIKSCEAHDYGGLLNVYSEFFKTRFAYCADSTGFWRYERLEDRLRDETIKHLQVLTHDAMWSREVLSPRKRVFAAIEERAAKTREWYDAVLNQFGAKNVDD